MSILRRAELCRKNGKLLGDYNAWISESSSTTHIIKQSQLRHEKKQNLSAIEGTVIGVKDNICTVDSPTSCASRMLADYRSPYDATVVRRLRKAGAILAGKTNLDEFGMGSHSTNSYFGPVTSLDGTHSAGGSSGGSAIAVATAQCTTALGTDTGGSVRLPASYTGIVGFKPTYGLLSRHGVVAYANSLDTVGILSRSTSTAKDVFGVLNAPDEQDPTCFRPSTRSRINSLVDCHHSERAKRPLRIGIPTEYNIAELHPLIRTTWLHLLRSLTSRDHTLHPVSLPTTKHALSAYYILAPSEAASNLAKYDGIRYGRRADRPDGNDVYASASRADGLGPEVKRRILLGSYSLSAERIGNYFLKAQKVRRLVQQDFDRVFSMNNLLCPIDREDTKDVEGVDVLITPTTPTFAPTLEDVWSSEGGVEAYMNDVLTVPASLAGLPALSIPVEVRDHLGRVCGTGTVEGVAGMQILGQVGDDALVLEVGALIESLLPLSRPRIEIDAGGDDLDCAVPTSRADQM